MRELKTLSDFRFFKNENYQRIKICKHLSSQYVMVIKFTSSKEKKMV